MSREKSPRPASLTEAITKLSKALTAFDNISSAAIEEAEKGDLSRAAALVKEGHPLLLAMKDAYNGFYGQVSSAAGKAKAEAAKAASPKEDKKGGKKARAAAEATISSDDEKDAEEV